MKKFIRNTSLIIGTVVVLAIFFYSINQFLFNRYSIRLNSEEKTIVCGASITRNAIKDSMIPGVRNASIAGRSCMDYFLSLKRIRRDNPQIETVITDFSFQSLPASRDYLFYHPKRASKSFENIYPLLDHDHLSDYLINYKNYTKSLLRYELTPNIRYIKNALHDLFPSVFDYKIPYIGSYTDRIEHDLDSNQLEVGIRQYFYHKGEVLPFSSVDINYLDSIIDYTRQEKLNLVLFSGPIHINARKKAPTNYEQEYRRRIRIYRQEEHVRILDFLDFPLPDSCFANHNHVNYRGAEVISGHIRDSLQLWYGS